MGLEGFPLLLEVVDDFDDDEEGQRDDEEGDDGVDEGTPIDDGRATIVEGSAVLGVHAADGGGEVIGLREGGPLGGGVALLQGLASDSDVGWNPLGGARRRQNGD